MDSHLIVTTLSYACMHFDALCTLMDKQEFRSPVSSTLPHGDDPSVHVDFGCGPGTASWAVMNILSNDACVTTIGHDHNPHMIELAHSMTFHVASAMTKTCLSECCHDCDWGEFERTVVSLCERRWNTVIVTANSLFGQATMQPSDIEAVIVLIAGICERTRESPVFVAGTHPPYSEEQVEDAWHRIARIAGANRLYDDRLAIVSGSPRRYEAPTWVDWAPPPQLAHLFRIVGAEERT